MVNILKLKLEVKGELFMLNKDEVLELLEKYKKLVHTQDRELFDEVFANNDQCNLIAITKHFSGRESIYNDFLLGGIQKNYRFIELISDKIDVLETQVIVKEEGKWKIQHIHYSK